AAAERVDVEDEAAAALGASRQSAPQRRARCHALANLASDRWPRGRYQHYVLRSQGHARSRHESVVRVEREDALLPFVLSFHRAQRRRADQLHFLRRHGYTRRGSLSQLQSEW